MNKIYKVIWSKTKHCYVAVAEFVKRNGKGSSSLNRRHIAAALAAVTLFAAPGNALADNSGGDYDSKGNYIGTPPKYYVVIDEDSNGNVFGRLGDDNEEVTLATVTVEKGGKALSVYGGRSYLGSVKKNNVIIDGEVKSVIGGQSLQDGSVEGNTVTISGGKASGSVYGGYSSKGSVEGNTVRISGGEASGSVYGGFSSSGSVEGNTVRISGGKVTGYVFGGYTENVDKAVENNSIILSIGQDGNAPVLEKTLYGGFNSINYAMISNNTLQVEAVGLSAPEIQNFDNYKFVLPSDVKKGDTMLTLKGQGADLTIDANKVDMAVAKGSGLNIDFGESVTLLHKTGGSGAFSVTNLTGAVQTSKLDGKEDGLEVMKYTLENPTDKLNVTVSELFLYGDGGNENENDPGQRQMGNTLTIKSGKANAAFGGRAIISHVIGNKVKMEGGELVVLSDEENPNYSISGNLYGGYAGDIHNHTNARDNIVEISGGTIGKAVYGGYSKNGNATGNTVEISGGKVGRKVYGGYAENGNATGNTVVISGGMFAVEVSGMEGSVYGGYAENGSATGNTVVLGEGLTGRTFDTLHLYGGKVGASGGDDTSDNTLQVEGRNIKVMSIGRFENYTVMLPQSVQAGDTILNSARIGGDLILDGSRIRVFSGGRLGLNLGESVTVLKVKTGELVGNEEFILNNADQIPPLTERLDNEATGFVTLAGKVEKAEENNDKPYLNLTVTEKYLYGDGGTNTPGQREMGNTLTINGGKANAAFGGRATTNDVTGNKVEMSGGELVRLSDSSDPDYNVSGNLYGGYTDAGNVQGNTVKMSGGKVDSIVVGGFSKAGAAGGDKPEDGNKVIMTGGEAREVMGGYTYDGAAGYNTVSVSNAKVAHATGGASLQGDAVGNTVTLTNTELSYKVTGGDAYQGRAAENTVTIDGGSVGMNVYGGVSISGNVENNTVSIRGGKINGVLDGLKTGLTGGYGSERVVGNTVAITGGELFVESVYGGYHTSRSGSGLAEKNVVTLGGGSYDAGLNVIGGGSNNEANDNAVNLTGTTQGLDGAKLYGWKETEDGATVTGTGNELHVGGTKTYDKNGEAVITKGSWQGMDASGTHTNKVETVANFDSIALHNVVWGDVPAISANEITNIGGLDVTGLEFFTHPDNSTVHEHALSDSMVLVHSDGNDLTGLNISYLLDGGTVKTEELTNKGILFGTTTHHTEENGVTVDGIEQKKIYLADHNQSVDFFCHVDGATITLGEVEFAKGGTARILDGRFDVQNAEIVADGFNMTDASIKNVEAGDAMTVVDAQDAIKATGATATLKEFAGKTYDFAFSDAVTSNLTLNGTRTDTLSQNGDKTKLTYTVGENVVSGATFDGAMDWKNGSTHYINQKTFSNGKPVYNFNGTTGIHAETLTINGTTDAVAKGDAMTLLSADGLTASNPVTQPADPTFAVDHTDGQGIRFAATAAGKVTAAANAVNYEVTGVTVDTIDLAKWNGTTSAMPEATWELAKDSTGTITATVETNGMNETVLHGLNLDPGQSQAILTSSNKDYFDGVTVNGEYVWHENGSAIAHNLTENGVTIAGTETKGGVRVDETNKSRLVYTQSQENVSDLTLEGIAFADGATARKFDKTYDLTKAAIHAVSADTLFTEGSRKTMESGNTMTLVDAEDAIKNGKGETLATFNSGQAKTYDVAFSDAVTGNLTLSGTHTDTLSQNAEKTKLTYTVGEKNVSNAVLTGNVPWSNGATHYTNKDYNFNTDAKTDLQGLTFGTVTSDPSGQSMTLVSGKVAGTVENAPASLAVTLTQANTTLDATAAGRAAMEGGNLTYRVTGVTLDKVTVTNVTTAADTVPGTWDIPSGLPIDTDSMTLPSGSANTEHPILTAINGSFAGATVTGQHAYASHSPFTLSKGGVTVAGEKEGGVKLSNDNKSVVYHVVQDHVKDVTLGAVDFTKDTTLLTVGDEYEFKKVTAVNAQNFGVSYASPETTAVNDSMTLLQANNTLQANTLLANMAADVKTQTTAYSFTPAEGVNVAGRITGSLGTTAKSDGFTYTVNVNQADKLTFGSVDWKDSGALFARPAAVSFEGAAVDTSAIHFRNVHGLDANKQMTLVSDFGDAVGNISGSKYYIGTTLEGEGKASLSGSDLIFTTLSSTNPEPEPPGPEPTPLHAQEQTHNTVMGMTAGISLLSSGAEQIGQAMQSLSLMDTLGGSMGSTITGTGGSTSGTGTTGQTGGTEGGGAAGQTGGTDTGSTGQTGADGGDTGSTGQTEGSGSGTGSAGSETGTEKGQGEGRGNESENRNEKGSGKSDQQESNAEANGIIIASVGGGKDRVETGSHVTSHTWNGVLGIGGKRATQKGTLQYLVFAEHGRANFTLHSDEGRGDGRSKYVGGGLIGKWQSRRDVYVEASLRAGRMHDTATDMLYDEATGQSYGYDVHANYIGGHVGISKVFRYDKGRDLDVYARYFHMKRDGVSFDAGGHFDLDSVTSSVLRVGARYGATDKKWNWYGGLAYEYEFDGKSTGRADGADIRAASMKGGSVRGEIGLRMEATKTSPWKADINLSGYGGRRRGISGNVAIAYTF